MCTNVRISSELTQQDVSLWFNRGISPVQAAAIDQAKKEYADGRKEPNAVLLRLHDVFGEDWTEAYVQTWRRLNG